VRIKFLISHLVYFSEPTHAAVIDLLQAGLLFFNKQFTMLKAASLAFGVRVTRGL